MTIQPSRSRSGIRPIHAVAIAGAGVIAAIVVFGLLHTIIGVVALVVKVAVVVAIVALVVKLVMRSQRSTRRRD